VADLARDEGITSAELMSVLRMAGLAVGSADALVHVRVAQAALEADPHLNRHPRPRHQGPAETTVDPARGRGPARDEAGHDAVPDTREPGRSHRPRRPAAWDRRVLLGFLTVAAVALAALVALFAFGRGGSDLPGVAAGPTHGEPAPDAVRPEVTPPPPSSPAPTPPIAATPSPVTTPGAVPVSEVVVSRTAAGGVRVAYRLGADALVVASASDARGRVLGRAVGRARVGPVTHVVAPQGGGAGPAVQIALTPVRGGRATLVTVPASPAAVVSPATPPPAAAPAPPASSPAGAPAEGRRPSGSPAPDLIPLLLFAVAGATALLALGPSLSGRSSPGGRALSGGIRRHRLELVAVATSCFLLALFMLGVT